MIAPVTADARINRFLREHNEGDLLIAVGFASPKGVAWLAEQTHGRAVNLLIGEPIHWEKCSEKDRLACLGFLNRSDVAVRTTDEHAHLKVWIVLTEDRKRGTAVLSGSANLTGKGLGLGYDTHGDGEAMAEVFDNDLEEIVGKVRRLWEKASAHNHVLDQALQPPMSTRHTVPVRDAARVGVGGLDSVSDGGRSESGCARRLALVVMALVVMVVVVMVVVGYVAEILPQQRSTSFESGRENPVSTTAVDSPGPGVEPNPTTGATSPDGSGLKSSGPDSVLVAECSDDMIRPSAGWEHGCLDADLIPAGVPCVVADGTYWRPGYIDADTAWYPDYFNGDGECRQNIALWNRPWEDCIDPDGGRWTGDWTASPYNGRWACPATLDLQCIDDALGAPSAPRDMMWKTPRSQHTWPPGWELGCDTLGLIPESVPCLVSADRPDMIGTVTKPGLVTRIQHLGIRGWLPGYLDGDGECWVNEQLFDDLDDFYGCYPAGGGRWTGDWAADPFNESDLC